MCEAFKEDDALGDVEDEIVSDKLLCSCGDTGIALGVPQCDVDHDFKDALHKSQLNLV